VIRIIQLLLQIYTATAVTSANIN